MANNKVELSTGEVLIDLTSDTVTASNLLSGETAHDRSGNPVTGTVNLNNYVLKSGDTMSGTLVCPVLTKTWGNASSDFEKKYDISSSGFAFTSKSESSSMYGASYGICQHDSLGLYLADGDGSSEHPITKSITLYTHNEGLIISKNGSTKSKITSDALQVNTHDLLRMSPYFAQMFATAIPANANLNSETYLKVGQYYVNQNTTVSTLTNCPTSYAFTMTVEATQDTTYDDESSPYRNRVRKITDYHGDMWVQFVTSSASGGVWSYNAWSKIVSTAYGDEYRRIIPHLYAGYATVVPSGANLNTTTYLKIGEYSFTTAVAQSCSSYLPSGAATEGRMTVYTPSGTTYDDESGTWKYRVREYETYSGNKWRQRCQVSGTAGSWTYGSWCKVVTTDDIQSITDLSSAGSVTTSTSWFDTGKSITIPSDGWWAIEAYCTYANGAPLNIAIVKEAGNYVYEQAYAERHGVFDKTVSQVYASHVGDYSANNVLHLWAKYNNATTNYACIKAKKLH